MNKDSGQLASQGRPTLRSFFVPAGAGRAQFRANIQAFLGVAPATTGALICALCLEPVMPMKTSGLVDANGQRLGPSGAAAEPMWQVFAVPDGGMPPPGTPENPPHYVGAIGAQQGPGGPVGGIFFFVQEVPDVSEPS